HMFVVYFATLSAITPPVAVASYAAAGISEANAATVGWQACRIGLVSFIVPFIFVFEPMLMVTPANFCLQSVWIVTSATLGVLILCAGLEGYLKKEIPMLLRGIHDQRAVAHLSGAISDYTARNGAAARSAVAGQIREETIEKVKNAFSER
ncbi:MAG: TRAP transporter large permease subunit, partial [Cloacibacillus evryensis]